MRNIKILEHGWIILVTYILGVFISNAQVMNLSEGVLFKIEPSVHFGLKDFSIYNSGVFSGSLGSVLLLKGNRSVEVSGEESLSVGELKIKTDVYLNTSLTVLENVDLISGIVDLRDSELLLGENLLQERALSRITSTGTGEIVRKIDLVSGVLSNPGNMGFTIVPSSSFLGVTIRRGHQILYKSDGEESLRRYFSFENFDLTSSQIGFKYFDVELGEVVPEVNYLLWGESLGAWSLLDVDFKDFKGNYLGSSLSTNINRLSMFGNTKEVFIPGGFSPNGDGANETFVIKNIELYPNNRLVVFNRWGLVVYKMDSYDNSWNGNWGEGISPDGGKELINGVYFYVLYKDISNLKDVIKGYVMLER